VAEEPKSFRKARFDSHDGTLATASTKHAYRKFNAASTITSHASSLHPDRTNICWSFAETATDTHTINTE
jgi:hypothetical protein